jgi:hypothetical protein
MKEELTTLMHCEFAATKEELWEILIMGVDEQIKKGVSIDDACKELYFEKQEYLDNRTKTSNFIPALPTNWKQEGQDFMRI